jgi:acetyltransferase-like isoleucine patch superfamily enzyme
VRRKSTTRHEIVGQTFQYARLLRLQLRARYVVAYGLARLVPVFSAGPIIARLYRWAGFDVADGCVFMGPVRVLGGGASYDNLVIGKGVYIANDVVFNVDGLVDIGDSVSIGPFVKIYTATHAVGAASRRMVPIPTGRPVTVGRGTWIGAGALILPGVSIGEGCIIGAGSVVTSSVSANCLVEGNPAALVRELPWANR